MTFGEKLTKIRKRKKLTQEDLSDKLNISVQTLSRWERDKGLPDVAQFSQLCKAVEVPVQFFVTQEEFETLASADAETLAQDEIAPSVCLTEGEADCLFACDEAGSSIDCLQCSESPSLESASTDEGQNSLTRKRLVLWIFLCIVLVGAVVGLLFLMFHNVWFPADETLVQSVSSTYVNWPELIGGILLIVLIVVVAVVLVRNILKYRRKKKK